MTEGTISREICIAPGRKLGVADLRELYRFRELLFFLVWRDVKVRYKQSVLGVAWVVLRPLASMIIFTVIFGRLAKLPSEGAPYAVFVLLGLVPWGYFSSAFSSSTNSIVGSSNLVSRVYFPRLIVPLGAALSQIVDLMVAIFFTLIVMAIYGIMPGPKALFMPLILVFTAMTALGPGLLLAALFVKYRDVGHVAPFVGQVWMYLTPVVYPPGFVPERYRWLLYLNPMSGVIDTFRACFIPGKFINFELLAISGAVSMVMFLIGFYYFESVERTFADNI